VGNDKLGSPSHKLSPIRAAGEDEIFAEHIAYADPSMCFYHSNLFNVF